MDNAIRQMNCPVCDAACWFVYGDLYVVKNIIADGKTNWPVVTLKPHECPKEKLEAMV